MSTIADQILNYTESHLEKLNAIPETEFAKKPLPNKWSKKEILGHLVDSALTNIRRFIISQYENEPHIVYNQDKWVAVSNYQNYETSELIQLWYLINKHLCVIINNTSDEMMQRTCRTENVHTLEWLAEDYLKHLKHHLHQVLELEPIAYP